MYAAFCTTLHRIRAALQPCSAQQQRLLAHADPLRFWHWTSHSLLMVAVHLVIRPMQAALAAAASQLVTIATGTCLTHVHAPEDTCR